MHIKACMEPASVVSRIMIPPITYGSSTTGVSNAWDTSGVSLGTSRDGEYGAWHSSNSSPDTASPGYFHFAQEIIQPLATLLYWADKDTAKIQRFNMETGHIETLLTSAEGLREPRGLAIDLASERMFWTDGAAGTIHQTNLDGTDDPIIISGQNFPTDLVLDAPWRLAFLEITADINQDGQVNFADFSHMALAWQASPCDWSNLWCHRTDLSGDGVVDINDLIQFSELWLSDGHLTPTCPKE